MAKCVIKFNFKTPVHFGHRDQTPILTKSDYLMQNDSFFSSLFIETITLFGKEKALELLDYCKEDKLTFSSMMPFSGEEYFILKPATNKALNADDNAKSQQLIKKYKKIEYLPMSYLSNRNNAELSVEDIVSKSEKFPKFAIEDIRQNNSVGRNEEETEPFFYSCYTYNKDCGAYIIMQYEGKAQYEIVDKILFALQYSGIGGRRSSGFGKFSHEIIKIDKTENSDLKVLNGMLDGNYEKYMSLGATIAEDDELEKVIDGALIKYEKRGGYIQTNSKIDALQKKKDVYVFGVGSTFNRKFNGKIVDVAPSDFPHKVYKNLKTIFVGVANEEI